MALEQNIKFLLDFTGGESLDAVVTKLQSIDAVLAGKLKTNIEAFATQLKKTGLSADEIKKNQIAIDQLTESTKKYSKEAKTKIELTAREIAQNQIDAQAKKDAIALAKAQILAIGENVKSTRQLEAANKSLSIQRDLQNTSTKEGIANVQRLNGLIDANNKIIKENSDGLKQQRLNVGNYTESIKKAFEGTGMLGDAVNKYMGIVSVLSEKIEALSGAILGNVEAEKASTIITEEHETAMAADTTEVEYNKVATESATVASKGLALSMATNPYVLAALAIAALTKIIYDNMTVTQDQRDEWDASKAGMEAWSKAADIAGVDAIKLAAEIQQLTMAQFALEETQIANIVRMQKLRTEAAVAREDAMTEKHTTVERIDLLTQYIEKRKEAGAIELEDAKKQAEIKEKFAEANPGGYDRALVKAAEESKKRVLEIEAEIADGNRKTEKQRTEIIEKDHEARIKMLQDAQKEEIESINTFDKDKIKELMKQLDKELKLNALDTTQKIDNLKKEQEKLGVIDADGVDHTAEFEREIVALKKEGANKAVELQQKETKEIAAEYQRRWDEEAKILDKQFKDLEERQQKEEDQKLKDFKDANKKKQDLINKGDTFTDKITAQSEGDKTPLQQLKDQHKDELAENLTYYKEGAFDLITAQENEREINAHYRKLERDAKLKEFLKNEEIAKQQLIESITARETMQQAADQRAIDMANANQQVQAKLAAGGLQNTLAASQAQFAAAEEKKLQDAKKAAKAKEAIELGSQLMKLVTTKIDKGESGLQALAESGAEVALIKLAANAIVGAFAGGIEGIDGIGTETSDSNLMAVSKGESVVTAAGTKQNPGLVTAMNKGVVDEYFAGKIADNTIFKRQNENFEKQMAYPMRAINDDRNDKEMLKYLKQIASKPSSKANLGRLGEWTEEIHLENMKTIVRHKNDISFR